MWKIFTIARREYQAMVATKAFLIGMAMMPVLMMGGMVAPKLLRQIDHSEERRIAVVDQTGRLLPMLKLAADQRNQMVTAEPQEESDEEPSAPQTDAERKSRTRRSLGMDDINTYVLEAVPVDEFDNEARLELSERVRSGELHAFVELPADLLERVDLSTLTPENAAALMLPEITYCSQEASLSDARRWLQGSLTTLIRSTRLSDAGVDAQLLVELERRPVVRAVGLYERGEDGVIRSEEKPSELLSMFLPMGIMMLMFMIVMLSAQPMLESVLEEKSARISEVLLGSANARQLMTGKLLGNLGGSITVFALYAGGAFIFGNTQGYTDYIPFHIIPWFIVYQILAVLLFSSVFMAIGASVNQLREAQSLLLPVWMLMMFPLMVWFNVVREPNSTLAVAASFFPPSTPLMMTLRLSTGAAIPAWQIIVSIVLLLAGTALGVTAASRIYRVGILWQGKTPKVTEVLGWIVRDPAKARPAAGSGT